MPKVCTVKRAGSRFYVDHETRVTVPGVTSVIGMGPKPFLAFWNAKMVAELAVDSLPFIEQMAQRDRQGAVDWLKGAARRYTKTRSDIGSAAHDLFERMVRGEGGFTAKNAKGQYLVRVHPDMEPYRANFADFLEAVNPELIRAEDIAWSDTHQYAGSFDGILRVWVDDFGKISPERNGEPVTLIVDWKTSKATYPDVAMQMSAYANADKLIDAEGDEQPLPEFDGAAVLHITPDQWAFKPVRIDQAVFDVFLALRTVFEWDRVLSKEVIGKPLARSVASLVTGTQRRV